MRCTTDGPEGRGKPGGHRNPATEPPTELIDAFVLDTDGVITRTASVHCRAWTQLFDEYLAERAERLGQTFAPFSDQDYRELVDGKPRFDGVRDFLASRAITLAPDDGSDADDEETIVALGNRKNRYFLSEIARHGVEPYESTLAFVSDLRRIGIRTAAVSASENARDVLRAGRALELFDVVVDGTDAARLSLPGKPDPALFLEAARQLGTPPRRVGVIEDALAGVDAARRGGFGLVVGVDRTGQAGGLFTRGADVVVPDLRCLEVDTDHAWKLREQDWP